MWYQKGLLYQLEGKATKIHGQGEIIKISEQTSRMKQKHRGPEQKANIYTPLPISLIFTFVHLYIVPLCL